MELPTKATKQIRKTDKDSRGVKDAKPEDTIFFFGPWDPHGKRGEPIPTRFPDLHLCTLNKCNF